MWDEAFSYHGKGACPSIRGCGGWTAPGMSLCRVSWVVREALLIACVLDLPRHPSDLVPCRATKTACTCCFSLRPTTRPVRVARTASRGSGAYVGWDGEDRTNRQVYDGFKETPKIDIKQKMCATTPLRSVKSSSGPVMSSRSEPASVHRPSRPMLCIVWMRVDSTAHSEFQERDRARCWHFNTTSTKGAPPISAGLRVPCWLQMH